LELFFSSLEWLEWLLWVECMRRSVLLMVFYFYNFSSWILIVLENSSFTFAFMNGIYKIFLIEGRLFGSLINISDSSFLRSGEYTSGRGG